PQLTRPILRDSPLCGVSFGEVIGMGKRRWRFEELLPLATSVEFTTDRLRIGLQPHAPYSVDLPGFRQCLQIANEKQLPLATHLAETKDEGEFLEHQTGIFRELHNVRSWEDSIQTHRSSPIRFASAIGLLDYPTLLAHVNYCDDDEVSLLASGRASVVYCPRTHAYFD